jgi:signal peptidase I
VPISRGTAALPGVPAMTSAAELGGAAGQDAGEPPRPRRPRPSRRRVLAGWAITLVFALLLAFGVRAYVFQAFSIPSTSMVPTLQVNDRILVQKLFFNWHQLREGDIVVFTHPPRDHCGGPAETDLVKRVIALPGQTIYSAGGIIYINGHQLSEPYLPKDDPLGPAIPDASPQHPFRVPAGEFYMLGDNRAISCDSRFWGPIKGSSIVGRVVLLLWRNNRPDFHWF